MSTKRAKVLLLLLCGRVLGCRCDSVGQCRRRRRLFRDFNCTVGVIVVVDVVPSSTLLESLVVMIFFLN